MGKNTANETYNVERAKVLYERLDTLYAAIPEINREEFVIAIQDLNTGNMDNVSWRATHRWLTDHKTR